MKENNLEGLLVICGSDGGNNKSSNIFMNYLFEGKSGFDLIADYHLDFAFEETMVFFTS